MSKDPKKNSILIERSNRKSQQEMETIKQSHKNSRTKK